MVLEKVRVTVSLVLALLDEKYKQSSRVCSLKKSANNFDWATPFGINFRSKSFPVGVIVSVLQ
jgi:hypothetical protein